MPESCTCTELLARVVALESGLSALKELLEERDERYKQRASSQDDAVKSALETSEKAIGKAEGATERRFEGVNEFRQTLADQAATLMPRAEYTVQHKSLEDKIIALDVRVNILQQGLAGVQARGGGIKEMWGYIIAIAAIIVTGFVEFFRR